MLLGGVGPDTVMVNDQPLARGTEGGVGAALLTIVACVLSSLLRARGWISLSQRLGRGFHNTGPLVGPIFMEPTANAGTRALLQSRPSSAFTVRSVSGDPGLLGLYLGADGLGESRAWGCGWEVAARARHTAALRGLASVSASP